MYRKFLSIFGGLFVSFAILIATSGYAATNPIDLGITTQYTHFIFGDATLSNGSTVAPVAYGGNVQLTNNNIGQFDGNCDPSATALTVGGSLNYANTGIHDGNGVVGGSVTAGAGAYNECGTTATGAVSLDFNGTESAMQTQATTLASAAVNGASDQKTCALKLTGSNGDLNVFSIPASALSNPNPGFACLAELSAACGSINLINVSGTTVDTSDLTIVRSGGVEPSQIVFNFYEATTLNLVGGQFDGTILAPYANVTMTMNGASQPVVHNGGIVAKSISGSLVSASHPFGATPDKCVPPSNTYDFGDLPAQYGTLLLDDGPRHILNSTLVLGTAVDADSDGMPSTLADGDDLEQLNDDDGVQTNPANWIEGSNPNAFGVTASEPGCLHGWVDWNEDGDFDEADEKIFDRVAVDTGLNALSFNAPSEYQGTKYARFRITPRDGSNACSAVIQPTGVVSGGEVEDYRYYNPQHTAITLDSAEVDDRPRASFIALIIALIGLIGLSAWIVLYQKRR